MGRVSEFYYAEFLRGKFYLLSKLSIIMIFRKPVFYREGGFAISPAFRRNAISRTLRIKDTNPTD